MSGDNKVERRVHVIVCTTGDKKKKTMGLADVKGQIMCSYDITTV